MSGKTRKIIEEIARTHLGLETLKGNHSDSLDFREHHVLKIRDALEAAFVAGVIEGQVRVFRLLGDNV